MSKNLTSPVRIGVIGCGAIAELYHLPALAEHPRTRASIALADPNATRLSAMKDKFSAREAVADYHDLLGRVDGVIVATPPHLHYPAAKWFLERGVHVLSEKPLTESSEEARELVAISERTGAKLAVNQTRRFFPTYQKIRQLIAQGKLGKLHSIIYHDGVKFFWPAASPHHFQPGAKGAWSDTGVHLLDSISYWLGASPRLIQSLNDSWGGPEAMATVKLEYQGCEIEIKVSRLGRLMNGFEICGSLASIKADAEDWDEFTVRYVDGREERFKCASNRLKYNDFAKPMLENFVQVIVDGAEPFVSGKSTLGTIELLEAASDSAVRYPMPWNEHLGLNFGRARQNEEVDTLPKRVLVTGAAGFVGARVVEAMALSDFAIPRAAIRQWSRASQLACRPMDIAICDILDRAQVDKTVEGVEGIVHCAYTDDRQSIVEGTRNLVEAALRYGVKHFVYLSSAEVYGTAQTGIVDEHRATTPAAGSYGESKLMAERVCMEARDRGLSVTILRPSLIYGPFGTSWSIQVAKRLQSGKWGLFDEFGDGIANLIYIDDLVQAIFLALQLDQASGQVFNVNGPDRTTWNQYFARFNQLLGLPPLQPISASKSKWRTFAMDSVRRLTSAVKARFEEPLMEIYLRGGWASRIMKRLKGELDSTPSDGELTSLYARPANYDDRKIQELLGYRPAFDLDRGIESTIDWMILHELIEQPQSVRRLAPRLTTSAATTEATTV